MYAVLTIQLPVETDGRPIVDIVESLKLIAPNIRRTASEGMERGNCLIPCRDKVGGIIEGSSIGVSWSYVLHPDLVPHH